MQKRKFDELISHFNRKVSDMSIDKKYKMELLGMISAIGFAHEKELSTNLAEVGTDCISRRSAIDALDQIFDRCEEIEAHLPEGNPDRTGYKMYPDYMTVWKYLHQLPSAQPEIIRCKECKHNPKYEWFGCPMSHLSEKQRPETAWCWKAERRTDE